MRKEREERKFVIALQFQRETETDAEGKGEEEGDRILNENSFTLG